MDRKLKTWLTLPVQEGSRKHPSLHGAEACPGVAGIVACAAVLLTLFCHSSGSSRVTIVDTTRYH